VPSPPPTITQSKAPALARTIEHEDVLLNSLEGLEKSVAFLKGVMPAAPSDFTPQAI
jgi:hypothetical protein